MPGDAHVAVEFGQKPHVPDTDMLSVAKEIEKNQLNALHKIGEELDDKINADKSEKSVEGRRLMAFRATYGEFMCTFLFLTPIYGSIAKMRSLDAGPAASLVVELKFTILF